MSTISASTLITTALQYTADTTGALVFQTGATPTTALTLGADQSATFAGTVSFATASFTNLSYTGTFTGGTGVIAIGTNQIYKDSSGNVGLGTSSPAYRLEIAGDLGVGINIVTGKNTSTGDCFIELGGNRTGSGNAYIDFHSVASTDYESRIIRVGGANGALQILNTGTGDFRLQASGAAPMIFDTTGTERMRITAAGNVGIGTTVPSNKLEINGNGGVVRNGADAYFYIQETSSQNYAQALILADSTTSWYVANRYGGSPVGASGFGIGVTNAGEHFQIDTSGNVYLGTANTYIKNSSGNIMAAQTGGSIQTSSNFVGTQITATNVGTATFWFQHSFTPRSSNSNFLITCSFNGIDNGGSGRLQVGLYYDTTSGGTTGTQLGFAQLAAASSGTNGCFSLALNRYMQTALTAGTTYYFKAIAYKNDTSTTWFCGEYGNISTITIQEIA